MSDTYSTLVATSVDPFGGTTYTLAAPQSNTFTSARFSSAPGYSSLPGYSSVPVYSSAPTYSVPTYDTKQSFSYASLPAYSSASSFSSFVTADTTPSADYDQGAYVDNAASPSRDGFSNTLTNSYYATPSLNYSASPTYSVTSAPLPTTPILGSLAVNSLGDSYRLLPSSSSVASPSYQTFGSPFNYSASPTLTASYQSLPQSNYQSGYTPLLNSGSASYLTTNQASYQATPTVTYSVPQNSPVVNAPLSYSIFNALPTTSQTLVPAGTSATVETLVPTTIGTVSPQDAVTDSDALDNKIIQEILDENESQAESDQTFNQLVSGSPQLVPTQLIEQPVEYLVPKRPDSGNITPQEALSLSAPRIGVTQSGQVIAQPQEVIQAAPAQPQQQPQQLVRQVQPQPQPQQLVRQVQPQLVRQVQPQPQQLVRQVQPQPQQLVRQVQPQPQQLVRQVQPQPQQLVRQVQPQPVRQVQLAGPTELVRAAQVLQQVQPQVLQQVQPQVLQQVQPQQNQPVIRLSAPRQNEAIQVVENRPQQLLPVNQPQPLPLNQPLRLSPVSTRSSSIDQVGQNNVKGQAFTDTVIVNAPAVPVLTTPVTPINTVSVTPVNTLITTQPCQSNMAVDLTGMKLVEVTQRYQRLPQY